MSPKRLLVITAAAAALAAAAPAHATTGYVGGPGPLHEIYDTVLIDKQTEICHLDGCLRVTVPFECNPDGVGYDTDQTRRPVWTTEYCRS